MWRINRCTMSLYIAAAVISVLASLQPLFLLLPLVAGQIPITTKSWELLIGQGNAKWTPRNGTYFDIIYVFHYNISTNYSFYRMLPNDTTPQPMPPVPSNGGCG